MTSQKSTFVSVEIVLKTNHECDSFMEWFCNNGDHYVEKIPCDTHRWHVYLAPIPGETADETIQRLCDDASGWPKEVRAEWDAAGVREFFVGYEIGSEPVAFLDHFGETTLRKAAEIGAGIGLALYPPAMSAES